VLRYKEKEDFESRFTEVDEIVEKWREAEQSVSDALRQEFRDKLIISLIYHDSALEGEVLSHSEIKAAIDTKIISDTSLIPAYDDIKNYYGAVNFATDLARQKRKPVKVDVIRELYAILDPAAGAAAPYRKENPLHRLYYHEIAPPEKISYRIRKLGEWMELPSWRAMHPIERAVDTHHRVMAIYPWTKYTGQVSRILANLILEHDAFPVAVIHSIDRQRYYEALRSTDTRQLLSVYLEAVETTAASALRVYDEAARNSKRQAS
jgi:Fic family protein